MSLILESICFKLTRYSVAWLIDGDLRCELQHPREINSVAIAMVDIRFALCSPRASRRAKMTNETYAPRLALTWVYAKCKSPVVCSSVHSRSSRTRCQHSSCRVFPVVLRKRPCLVLVLIARSERRLQHSLRCTRFVAQGKKE